MKRFQYLLPWRRRAEERDMKQELASLAEMSERGELGNLTIAAENARAVWGWTWLEQLWRDVQYALRMMRKNPGFTTTAIFSLALGIGANTAIFSLIDALMLRWLPVRQPQELIRLVMRTNGRQTQNSFSYPEVNALRQEKSIFSGLCGFTSVTRWSVGPRDAVESVTGVLVSGAYYETLGLVPQLGRLLTGDDDRPGAAPVVVITDGYWERKYARDPGVIGRSILIEGTSVSIAGVSPPGFSGTNVGQVADLTAPLALQPQLSPQRRSQLDWSSHWLRVIARPSPGVSPEQIRARLNVAWAPIRDGLIPEGFPDVRRRAQAITLDFVSGGTGYTDLRQQFTRPLLVLMAVVGVVLLIACANIANLLLARATARQREIAVRLAIGAGRWRIIRQLLTESLLLSASGAILGIALAWMGSSRIIQLISSSAPGQVVFDLSPNSHVLGFTTVVSVLTGVLFGLAPAFRATGVGPASALQDNTRGPRSSRGRLIAALVTAQVAMSLLLLVAGGLFVRTLENLRNFDPGFRSEGVLVAPISAARLGYRGDQAMTFYVDLLRQIQAIPGVASASFSALTPLSGSGISNVYFVNGQPVDRQETATNRISPGYFATLRTPLLLGRDFTFQDTVMAPRVAIVNEAFASRYLSGNPPLDRHLATRGPQGEVEMEVVGVVKNSNYDSLRENLEPQVYTPYLQGGTPFNTFEVYATGSVSDVASRLRAVLQSRSPGSAIEVRTLTAQVEQTLVKERLMATLAAGFGGIALALASVGLYGMLAYAVSRRTNEIGIRMAIGARRDQVLRLVIGDAVRMLLLGVLVGLPAAWAGSRLITSMLFHLQPTDPATLSAATGILVTAGFIAALAPALRASRIDPMAALRHE